MSSFRRAITGQILVAKKYIPKLRPPKDPQYEGMVFTYDHSNSPIGKAVWMYVPIVADKIMTKE
jgi:hypothetical protein